MKISILYDEGVQMMKTANFWGLAALVAVMGILAIMAGCGDPSGGHVHDWGEYSVTTPADCLTAGVETRTCGLDSSHTETRAIAALGHGWGEWAVSVAATETTDGTETRICKHNAEHKENRTIEKHVHNWGEWEETIPPTCTEEGVKTRTCSTGNETETEPGSAALGHDWGDWVTTIEPTETDEGEEQRTCQRDDCGEIETIVIPAGIHNWSDWMETTPATCTEEGIQTRYCQDADCDETKSRSGSAMLGHEWPEEWEETLAPTCEDEGEEKRVCGNNPAHIETHDIDALGHDWEWGTITTEPTCTTAGVQAGICNNDPEHETTRPVAELGHEWKDDWTVTDPATCEDEGEEEDTCNHDASHTRQRIIQALGHDYQNWTETKAPNCTEASIETGTCTHDATHTTTRTGAIDPDGHDWGNWTQTTEPSFITEGVETRTCTHTSLHIETRTGVPSLPITTTAEWETALSQLNGKTGDYTLNISGNIGVAGSTVANPNFGTTPNNSLSVTLKGSGKLYLTSQGSIINIGANQTLIIDSEDLVLEGLKNGQNGASQDNNNHPVVLVLANGTLELKNGTISGNTGVAGGGVNNSGTFTMNGGTITGNTTSSNGSGVFNYGTFTMNGGTISDNTGNAGGGVWVNNNATFTMNGGTITGNTTRNNGGGVYVSNGTFNQNNGSITGNTPNNVYISRTVIFNTNGGSTVSSVSVEQGNTISAPATPTKTGYECIFDGWYADSDLTARVNFPYRVDASITLYAKWKPYEIGNTGPGGGRIFYRSQSGFIQYTSATDTTGTRAYYLEAAPVDLSTALAWASANYTTYDISGTATAIGMGRKNTAVILARDTNAPAARACFNYNNNNYRDWFLPSADELNELYKNRTTVGNLGTNSYWSSSQAISYQAWRRNFSNGNETALAKSATSSVRAVRAF